MSIYDERPYPPYSPPKPFGQPNLLSALKHSLDHAWYKCFRDRPPSAPRILDIGCGTGLKTLWLQELNPTATITGVDCSQNTIEAARDRAAAAGNRRAEFKVLGFEKLAEELGQFDYVNCDETMYLQKAVARCLDAVA